MVQLKNDVGPMVPNPDFRPIRGRENLSALPVCIFPNRFKLVIEIYSFWSISLS